jgi:predicted nucleic acid-binding protein
MNDRVFLDSNVVLYAFRLDDPRNKTAARLLAAGATLGVQTLNEFVNVARRKLAMPWDRVFKALEAIRFLCPEPVPITIDTHDIALAICNRYGCGIYDALIVAAAIEAQCDTLYSEDMRHGQKIDGLTIRNPFRQ